MARKTASPTPPENETPPRLPRLRNVSPLGALDVPAIGRIVQAGEVFEAPDPILDLLAEQAEHFEPTDAELFVPGVDDTTEGDADEHAA